MALSFPPVKRAPLYEVQNQSYRSKQQTLYNFYSTNYTQIIGADRELDYTPLGVVLNPSLSLPPLSLSLSPLLSLSLPLVLFLSDCRFLPISLRGREDENE